MQSIARNPINSVPYPLVAVPKQPGTVIRFYAAKYEVAGEICWAARIGLSELVAWVNSQGGRPRCYYLIENRYSGVAVISRAWRGMSTSVLLPEEQAKKTVATLRDIAGIKEEAHA